MTREDADMSDTTGTVKTSIVRLSNGCTATVWAPAETSALDAMIEAKREYGALASSRRQTSRIASSWPEGPEDHDNSCRSARSSAADGSDTAISLWSGASSPDTSPRQGLARFLSAIEAGGLL